MIETRSVPLLRLPGVFKKLRITVTKPGFGKKGWVRMREGNLKDSPCSLITEKIPYLYTSINPKGCFLVHFITVKTPRAIAVSWFSLQRGTVNAFFIRLGVRWTGCRAP